MAGEGNGGRVALLGGGVVLVALAAAGWFVYGRSSPDDEERPRGFGDYRVENPSKVYYGDFRIINRPAEVTSAEVYAHVPEYRQIRGQGIRSDDPRYHLLMREASARFSAAVKAMAKDLQHDFVAETGAVEVLKETAAAPVDRTEDTIARIR